MKMILMIASFMLLAVNSVQGQCTEVVNCNTCDDRGPECINCPAGKVLSKDKASCLDCPTDCAKCERKDDTDDLMCLECSAGYLKEGACEPCELENCKKCTVEGDEETCTECDNSGYSLSSGKCTGCPTGKYLDGTSCKPCPSNAVSCTTGGSVTACKDEGVKYVKDADSKKCLACSGCVKCALDDTAAKCTECKENQYLKEDGTCSFCDGTTSGTKCKSCEGEDKCSECNPKFYLKDDECKDCPPNCDECSEVDNAVVCGTCSVNNGLNGENICEKCPSNCKTCTDENTCTTCEDGYDKVTSTGVCKACPSDCKTCDTDATQCVTCKDSAHVKALGGSSGVSRCYDSLTGCTALLTDASADVEDKPYPQCATCDDGYQLDTVDNKCKSCTVGLVGCKTCTLNADGTRNACEACADGFVKDAETITKCLNCAETVPGCKECSATNEGAFDVCTACLDGYVKDAATITKCLNCAENVPGCKTCEAKEDKSFKVCSACLDGYVADAITIGKCLNCAENVPGCKTCEANVDKSFKVCSACLEGYLPDADPIEKCLICSVDNCKTDMCTIESKAAHCSECKAGYRQGFSNNALDGKCTKCSTGCNTCQTKTDGSEKCTACDPFYILENEACVACPDNCAKCPDTTSCTTCGDGYGKVADGTCVECIANCKKCDADSDGKQPCSDCDAKFYEENADCVACPGNCDECTYNTGVMECSKCAAGYVLNSGKCDKCPSNCKECSSATKCKTGKCGNGFAVNGNGECQDCAGLTGIGNCASCTEKPDSNSSAPCLACNAGFVLKDNLQSGDDAECVSSTVDCKGGAVADRPFQCDEGSCTGETKPTGENLCGRECYVCGDYDKDVFVPADECKTDNTSGTVILCPSGFCAMKSRNDDGKFKVAGGCLPVTGTCEDEDVACQSVGEGDEKFEQCTKCCGTNLCLQNELTTGVESGNLAPAISANVLLLVSLSMGALTMLLSRA